jgi:glucose/arabinose dehydrogenase
MIDDEACPSAQAFTSWAKSETVSPFIFRSTDTVDPHSFEWAVAEASPSGIAIVGDQVYLACLRGERLYRIGLDGQNRQGLNIGDFGRLRHVARAPDGSLWVLTSNRDGRGIPQPDDDRIIRITL